MSQPLSNVVELTINLSNPGLTRQGFGRPLVLSNTGNAWATPELTRLYTKDSYADDFPSGTVENAILGAIFSQPSPPTQAMVGKGPTKPTQIRTVQILMAVEGATYKIKVWSDGTLWSASYVAGGGDTEIDIAAALVALLTPDAWVAGQAYALGERVLHDTGKMYEATQAGTSDLYGSGPTGTGQAITDGTVVWKYIVTPNFTAINSGTDTITATGSAAGNWFALEPIASGDPDKVSNLMTLTDTTSDPGVADDLDAIFAADQSWYELTVPFKSSAILSTSGTGVSPWCASHGRLLVAAVSDTECATVAFDSGTDVLVTLAGQGSSYTAPQWHPRDYEWLDACTAGYFLSIEPGKDNWTMKNLTGPTPVNLTPTQTANLEARRAGYYATMGGQNLLQGDGKVENTTFGFIDNRRNIDWYGANLQVDLVDIFVKDNKTPNTTGGRRKIALAITKRNEIGIQKGVISPDPLDPLNPQAPIMEPYTVFVPPVTDESSFEASTRTLSGASTAWKLASPINKLKVEVNITQ
jgi:hypothetical protein